MTDKEKLIKAFSGLHASPDMVREAMEMANSNGYIHKKSFRKMTTVTIAVCLCLALGVTAFAAVIHGDFFKNVFGTGIASQEQATYDKYDEAGNVISTYTYPLMERVDVDGETAEELIGKYVSSLDESLTIGDWTWSIGEYIFDENGMGALTIRLSNPNGIDEWRNAIENHSQPPVGAGVTSEARNVMTDRNYVVEDSWTDTSVDMVYYIAPFGALGSEEGILFSGAVYHFDDEGEAVEIEEGIITIPSEDQVSAVELADGDIKLSVSPIGMMLTYRDYDDSLIYEEDEIVIKYLDGSRYTVESDRENIVNSSVGAKDEKGTIWTVFNRLVDPEKIESITIEGKVIDAADEVETTVHELIR